MYQCVYAMFNHMTGITMAMECPRHRNYTRAHNPHYKMYYLGRVQIVNLLKKLSNEHAHLPAIF